MFHSKRTIRSVAIITGHAGTLVNFRGHLLETLSKAGHDVHCIGPAIDDATKNWLAARSIQFHEVSISRNSISPFRDVLSFFNLWLTLRMISADATISYMIKPTIYGIIAGAAAGVPYKFAYITGLGYAFTEQPENWRWRIVNRVARLLYSASMRFTTAVAFQNEDDERDFRRWGLLPATTPSVVVGGEGVDTEHFKVMPLPSNPQCLMIARLVEGKGVAEYIEAARIVKAARPDAQFAILGMIETGPGAFPFELMQAAEAAGIVNYLGTTSDVRPHIEAARIFVLPSFYREGTPRSLMEAMAMGRPIVTTDVPGCRDTVVDRRNGILVPPKDATALAAAIIDVIENPEHAAAMGREGRIIAETKYEIGKVTNAALGFFWMAAQADVA